MKTLLWCQFSRFWRWTMWKTFFWLSGGLKTANKDDYWYYKQQKVEFCPNDWLYQFLREILITKLKEQFDRPFTEKGTFDNRKTISFSTEPVHSRKSVRILILISRSIFNQLERLFAPSTVIQLLGQKLHVVFLPHSLTSNSLSSYFWTRVLSRAEILAWSRSLIFTHTSCLALTAHSEYIFLK